MKQWVILNSIIQNIDNKKKNKDLNCLDVDTDTLIKIRTGMNVIQKESSFDPINYLALEENADLFNEKKIKVYLKKFKIKLYTFNRAYKTTK